MPKSASGLEPAFHNFSPKFPAKTLPELIAYAEANPGQVSYAGSTPGSAQHLGWEMIKRKTGTDMQFVLYKGPAH